MRKGRVLSILLTTAMAATIFTGCGSNDKSADASQKADKKKIGIVTLVEYGAFTDM